MRISWRSDPFFLKFGGIASGCILHRFTVCDIFLIFFFLLDCCPVLVEGFVVKTAIVHTHSNIRKPTKIPEPNILSKFYNGRWECKIQKPKLFLGCGSWSQEVSKVGRIECPVQPPSSSHSSHSIKIEYMTWNFGEALI